MESIFIFIGGALGTLLRYITTQHFGEYPQSIIGTFAVNILGCFIIGFISYIAIKRHNIISDNQKKFFTVGLAGGLTTFSTFSLDIFKLFIAHHYMLAMLYIFFSVIIGLIFISWGMNSGYYLLNFLIKQKRIKLKAERRS